MTFTDWRAGQESPEPETPETPAVPAPEETEEAPTPTPQPAEATEGEVEESTSLPAVALPAIPERLAGLPCRCGSGDCTIPYGLCHCGCGSLTALYTTNDERINSRMGEHMLIMTGHTRRPDGSGSSLPHYDATGYDRVLDKRLEDIEKPFHRRMLLQYMRRAVVLYEAIDELANENGRSDAASFDAITMTGRKRAWGEGLSQHTARTAWNFLVDMGACKPHGPGFKDVIKHPKECRPDLWEALLADGWVPVKPRRGDVEPRPAKAEKAEVANVQTPTPVPAATIESGATIRDVVKQAAPSEIATAVAQGMWTRYEWAISEVGRLNESNAELRAKVKVQEAEIERLRAAVPEPADAQDIALRVLS